MTDTPLHIDAAQARHKVAAGEAVLVCAYEDEATCRALLLDGAMSLEDFEDRPQRWAREREIIFYGESEEEAVPQRLAEEYRERGYDNVRVLLGGVRAWKAGGYPMAAETAPENPAAP